LATMITTPVPMFVAMRVAIVSVTTAITMKGWGGQKTP
jgi:hypothetical protein